MVVFGLNVNLVGLVGYLGFEYVLPFLCIEVLNGDGDVVVSHSERLGKGIFYGFGGFFLLSVQVADNFYQFVEGVCFIGG